MDNFVIRKNTKPLSKNKPINIYTDGACSNNGKPDARAGFGIWFGEKDETFLDLISELDRLDNIERIRVSSIEPNLLNESIIEFCNSSKLFMPWFLCGCFPLQ